MDDREHLCQECRLELGVADADPEAPRIEALIMRLLPKYRYRENLLNEARRILQDHAYAGVNRE